MAFFVRYYTAVTAILASVIAATDPRIALVGFGRFCFCNDDTSLWKIYCILVIAIL